VKRDIEWIEKLDDGIKRTVRVRFPGHGKIKWQFKRSDEELWDYDTRPAEADWASLEEKIDALYHRRRAPYRDLLLVQQLRRKAASG
jgi:hypothetical protein